jgi:ribosome-binding protein aMBF1 (putative translation factor)
MRVKFNESGQQRMFIDYARQKAGISMRKLAINNNVDYELLKKYHQERCFISKEVFDLLCKISGVRKQELNVGYLPEYWGQVKGGKS